MNRSSKRRSSSHPAASGAVELSVEPIGEAKAAGCWVYGADAEGAPYTELDYGDDGLALVMGAEGKGLRPRVRSACDALVAVPLRGRIESLNVSAAAAVLLYAIFPAAT